MFFVTFYSYKGGVGRTSALVNVAAFLASRDKRVLIIDFDLEAPGITAYAQFSAAEGQRGVVDYVREYIDTSIAPRVDDFVFRCDIGYNSAPVWVMPAGKLDNSYSSRLTTIDWQDLYASRSGYLLFEDMKQQLKDTYDFDYVLVDSRTGHTDVGGICTRQLADAVVLMFLPTVQNVQGMNSVVTEIKFDLESRGKDLPLLFVPANVPYLDDEYGILARNMEAASEVLGFDVPDATIHHYDSLALIDSSIFALSRPKSRLASEYGTLHDAIVSRNVDDRYAALQFLKNFRRRLGDYSGGTQQFETILDKIGQAHIGDPEIAMGLASAYGILGQEAAELDSLNVVIDRDNGAIEARLRRARLLSGRGLKDEAIADLTAIFRSPKASARVLSSAIELLKINDHPWLELSEASQAVSQLRGDEIEAFCRSIMVTRDGSRLAVSLLSKLVEAGEHDISPINSEYGLALIGAGEFQRAYNFYQPLLNTAVGTNEIIVLFNIAMAEWAKTGSFDRKKVERLVELDDGDRENSNYQQCIALCRALLGDKRDAIHRLDSALSVITAGRTFSCWTYLYRDKSEMIMDIEKMKVAIASGSIIPDFIRSQSI